MNPDRWSRIERLYHDAVARGGADRARFLTHACGDDSALLAEVESLLREDAADGPFLEESALAVAARLIADEIPVMTGRMFGPYRIDDVLGAGAMGDVYRAHDTTLKRDVAIKILPEAFSDDPIRLARFEQEAQFLASLSHPNIAAIYGVHASDGIRGLVLELVDGETLAERIRRGPLPLYEAARIAQQIGEGLDAAHQRGIVHRDLKPSNIKVTREGTAKILDFGLAMASTGESDGITAGTSSYMSPEQKRGDAIDKRTDIWSFGCVCFEMLSGVPAFSAEKAEGVPGAQPDWSVLPASVPPGVTRILKRCLEADPRRRRRDVGDVLVDLDEALNTREAPGRGLSRAEWLAVAATVLVLVALTAGLVRLRQQAVAVPSDSRARLSLLLPPGTHFPARENQIAVSPDGSMIAYVGATAGDAPRLVLRKLDAQTEQIIGDAIDVRDPFFSPDGRWIGFIAGDTIRKVSIADGRSEVVCRARQAVGASWSGGWILFGEGGDNATTGINRVAEKGGPVEVLTSPNHENGERNHSAPQLLPDGRTLIYTVRAIEPSGTVHRVVGQSAGGSPRVLVEDARFGRYIGDSVFLYQRGRALFATNLDIDTLTVSGPGVMIFSDVSPEQVWAAGGGVLAYRPQNVDRRFVWVNRRGAEVSVPAPPKLYGAPNLSPTDDRIATEIDEGGKFDVWILDIDRQTQRKLTDDGTSRYPMWTPDGLRVGVAGRHDNSVSSFAADGSGREVLVRATSGSWIGSWTPDARTLVYMREDPDTRSDLWAVNLDRKTPPWPIVKTSAREYGGRLSPDGRWLAYFSDETVPNQFDLYVMAFAPGSRRHRVATGGVREAVWSKDGRELFYRQGRQMMSIRVPPDGNFLSSRPAVVFEGDYFSSGGPGIVNYDVSADGQRFLMLMPVEDRTPHLNVVQGLGHLIRERLMPGAP